MLRIVFQQIIVDTGDVVGWTLREPFDRLLSDGPTGTGPPEPHLEDLQVTPTISSIFEFDFSQLQQFNNRAARSA
jgi:hypothetical protein